MDFFSKNIRALSEQVFSTPALESPLPKEAEGAKLGDHSISVLPRDSQKEKLRQHAPLAPFSNTDPSPIKNIVSSPGKESMGNKVRYPDEKICIFQDPSNPALSVVIPSRGSFEAGPRLRTQLGNDLFETMVDLAIAPKSTTPSKQLELDIARSTSFVLKEAGTDTISLRSLISPSDENGSTILEDKLTTFFGSKLLCDTIGSVANQMIAASGSLVCTQALLPSAEKEARRKGVQADFVSFDAAGAIGFPLPASQKADGSTATLDYELEKITTSMPPAFLLTLRSDTGAQEFYLKQENQPSLRITLAPQIHQTAVSTIQFKLTPNTHFDSELPLSKENFPCSVECVDFKNAYRTLELPQENRTRSFFSSVLQKAAEITSK